jgi:hypothetical protein
LFSLPGILAAHACRASETASHSPRVSATKVGRSQSQFAGKFAADLSSRPIRGQRQDGLERKKTLCRNHFLRHRCADERTALSLAGAIPDIGNGRPAAGPGADLENVKMARPQGRPPGSRATGRRGPQR